MYLFIFAHTYIHTYIVLLFHESSAEVLKATAPAKHTYIYTQNHTYVHTYRVLLSKGNGAKRSERSHQEHIHIHKYTYRVILSKENGVHVVKEAGLAYGGMAASTVCAKKTEEFLIGKVSIMYTTVLCVYTFMYACTYSEFRQVVPRKPNV